jgi:hypothetical protein
MVIEFREAGSVCYRKHVRRRSELTGETLKKQRDQQLLYCKSSLVSAWPPRSPDLTPPHFVLWDFSKKEFIRIIHEAWSKLKTKLNKLLPTLTQKHFANSEHTKNGWMLLFGKVVVIFSICCKAVLLVLLNKWKLKRKFFCRVILISQKLANIVVVRV